MKVRAAEQILCKNGITLTDMPAVEAVQRALKEDESSVKDYCKLAMGLFTYFTNKQLTKKGYYAIWSKDFKIYDAVAQIAKNSTIQNYWDTDSGNIDVWIEWLAVNRYYGAVYCGMYLSDIYSIPCEMENGEDLYYRMYISNCEPNKRNVNLG